MDTIPFRSVVLFASVFFPTCLSTLKTRMHTKTLKLMIFMLTAHLIRTFWICFVCIINCLNNNNYYESIHGFFFSSINESNGFFFVCCPQLAYQTKYIVMNLFSAEVLTCQWQANPSNSFLAIIVRCLANIEFMVLYFCVRIVCEN